MKKHLLTLILCALGIGASYAATVSGTIWTTSSCGLAAGQKVYLRDTTGGTPYVDSAVTNSIGFYSMTFPSSWPNSNFQLMMPACGTMWIAPGYYIAGNNVSLNATVCGVPKYLGGSVASSGLTQVGEAKVWLIRVRRNYPTVGDTTLTAVDSVTLGQFESAFQFMRPCTPTDTFICKAALLPSNLDYLKYLPTYHAPHFPGATQKGCMDPALQLSGEQALISSTCCVVSTLVAPDSSEALCWSEQTRRLVPAIRFQAAS